MDREADRCASRTTIGAGGTQIGVAALDRYRGHPTAERTHLPETIRVLDAFHVVRLTGDQVVDGLRLVQQILGLRDHPE